MDLIGAVKKKMGIGQTLGGRKAQIDGATGETTAAPEPTIHNEPATVAQVPPVQTDPNSEAAKAMAAMKSKYGLKKGGVVTGCAEGGVISKSTEKRLLAQKAIVKQKRGC